MDERRFLFQGIVREVDECKAPCLDGEMLHRHGPRGARAHIRQVPVLVQDRLGVRAQEVVPIGSKV